MMLLKILGRVDDEPTAFDGMYVSAYDPSFFPPNGVYDGGLLEVTDDPMLALQFSSAADALECWKKSYGIRPWDGKPNRPLTAFHVTVERFEVPSGGGPVDTAESPEIPASGSETEAR